MSNFITKNLIQCNLSELKLKSKDGFTFGGLTGDPYITTDAYTISANVNNTIDLTSTTINLKTISSDINLVSDNLILLASTSSDPTGQINHVAIGVGGIVQIDTYEEDADNGKFYYTKAGKFFYNTPGFEEDFADKEVATIGDINTAILGAGYIPNAGNDLSTESESRFVLKRDGLMLLSTNNNMRLKSNSLETRFKSSFYMYGYDDLDPLPSGKSSAIISISAGNGYAHPAMEISPSTMRIGEGITGDINILNEEDVVLRPGQNIELNPMNKAYYAPTSYGPIINDKYEIAVKGDFEGYIPNAGNVEDIDFALQRKKITLKTSETNELEISGGLYFWSNDNLFHYDSSVFSVQVTDKNFSIVSSGLWYSVDDKVSCFIQDAMWGLTTSNDNDELYTHAQYDIFSLYSKRKSDKKKRYELQLMEGNSWIKSETGNWEFALSQYDGGLTWSGPASAIQAGKYQLALYGKGANSGTSYNIDNDIYDLILNPGGTTISTNSGTSKTYLNLTMGTIESKSTWDDYADGIAAHKVYASSGEFYTFAKNPGNYAYEYFNGSGFGGIKINNPGNHQQLTMYDGTPISTTNRDYDLIKDYSTGLNYQWYFNKSSGDTSDKNYVKLNATNSNFNYSYNSTTDTYTTTTGLSFYPNSFNISYNNVNSAGQDDLTSNFGFQIHTTMFGLTASEDTYTSGSLSTATKTGTYITTATSSTYEGLNYKISTKITDPSKFSGSRMNIGLKIGSSDIDIYAGDGTNYAPKSRLYMAPTTSSITGEYNGNTYKLEWKWMQGSTLGLYASSTDGYTPVLKGFKVYDEDDNLISDSYLPLTGGILTGNVYIETDYSAYDTLKGKTSLNSGAIYLELLDAPTYGTWNSQLGMSASSGITWSRNQITGSHNTKYQTNVQLIDSGYYLYTKDTSSNKADSIYLQSGQLELVNNRVTDTSHAEGQVNLSTTNLYIINGNNQVNLSCDPSNIQLYLSGTNQTIRLSKEGLTFDGDDIPVESLYFSKDGIGYTTKEAYGKKTTYYLTSSGTNISYKNQSETGTLTFKPASYGNGEIKFTISNTIDNTTNTVTIYDGHTSTTQTNFDDADYITKKYSDEQYEDLLEKYIALEARVRALEPPVLSSNQLKTKSLDTIQIKVFDQHANDDYTIDWGDGDTSLSGNAEESTLTHNYSEEGVYIITVTPNNDNAAGHFITDGDGYFTEVNVQDFQFSPGFDNYLVKGTFDNQILTAGSGYPFISDCSVLKEVHIKENCNVTLATVFEDCPALTKVVMDAPITNYDGYLVENCPNLTELHLTSTTMPTFLSGSSLFDTMPNNLKIYVPNALVNDYKTALPDYTSYIQGE